jgi:hypothetical protein
LNPIGWPSPPVSIGSAQGFWAPTMASCPSRRWSWVLQRRPATFDQFLIAGVAGIVAGSISMAAGEYVSVSSQRDSEKPLIARERQELIDQPDEELLELAEIYQAKGLTASTARSRGSRSSPRTTH